MPRRALSIALLALLPMASNAMNILLTNDDGLTPNVKALRAALIAAVTMS